MNDLVLSKVSMTSIEIAELVESRHSNVKVSIDRLVKRGVIKPPALQHTNIINDLGVITGKRDFYVFEGEQGKRDSIIVVAQLCPEFTARLVDRWRELEEQVRKPALPDFSNPAEAARAWANEYEQKQLALQRVEQLELVVEETTKYYSLMRVLIANPESHLSKYTAWRPLKKYCQEHNLEIKKTWDDRYGSVNLYPREAWEEIYPYINLPDECAVLLGEAKDEP